MIQEIFVVEDKEEIIKDLKPKFGNKTEIVLKPMPPCNLSSHLLDLPSLILINEDNLGNENLTNICKLIRNNEDNSATPIIVITSNASIEHEKDILKNRVEYYIKKPFDTDILYYSIKNIIELLAINRGISPLTKLPRKHSDSSRIKKTIT